MNGWKQQWKKKRMHRMIQQTLRMSWITCRHVKCIYIWKSASILPHECERCTRMGCTSASIHYGSWFSFNSRFSAVATQHYIFVAIHQQWIPTETQHRTKKNQKKNEKEPPKTKTTTKKPLRVLYRSLMHLPCYTLFANRLSQTVTLPWTHRQTEAFASNVRCINFLDSITTMFYAIVRFAPRARALLRLHCTSMHLI